MKVIKGNLVKAGKRGDFDIIAHGCNCFCTMGSGIAKEMRAIFPRCYAADCETIPGNASKLGTVTIARYDKIDIVNCYTQYNYGKGGIHANYDAIRGCMQEIKRLYSGKRIGLPKIGCGLAGGSWGQVKLIIEEELAGENVTIMYL